MGQNGSLNPGGIGIPLVIFSISGAAAASALVLASLSAAAIKSSSMLFSDGCKQAFVDVDADDPALGGGADLHQPAARRPLDLDLVEILLRRLHLGLDVLGHLHDFFEARHGQAPFKSRESVGSNDFERCVREGLKHRADIWFREHFRPDPLLGHLLLLEQRRLARLSSEIEICQRVPVIPFNAASSSRVQSAPSGFNGLRASSGGA